MTSFVSYIRYHCVRVHTAARATNIGWGSIYECTSQPKTSRINQAGVSSLWILASDRYIKMEDVYISRYACKSLGAVNARCPRAMKPAMVLQRRSCFLCKTLLKLDLKENSVGPFPPSLARARRQLFMCRLPRLIFRFRDGHAYLILQPFCFISTYRCVCVSWELFICSRPLAFTSSWLSCRVVSCESPACFAFFKCPVSRQSLACQFHHIGYTHMRYISKR